MDRNNSRFDGDVNVRLQALEAKFTSSTHDASSPPENPCEEAVPFRITVPGTYRTRHGREVVLRAITPEDRIKFGLDRDAIKRSYQWIADANPWGTTQPWWISTGAWIANSPILHEYDIVAGPLPVAEPVVTSTPVSVESPASEPAPAPRVVEGGMYLTAEHVVVGPMSPALEPDFPGQLQGPVNGNPDYANYYFLPNGNYYPDDDSRSRRNKHPWNRILRPLVDYRPDHPRDLQFAPGSIPGSQNDRLAKGKKFRLTGEFRVARPDEFFVCGNYVASEDTWGLAGETLTKPFVISQRTHSIPEKRLIAVEYPAPTKDA